MKKIVIRLLILLLVIPSGVSASNHCADMAEAVAVPMSDVSSHASISSAHEHHIQALVVNESKTDCGCSDNMHCVTHLSVYVAMSDLSVKPVSFSSTFLIYNASLSPSETISPEIKPPSPLV